jgi:hypothetical protein
MPDAEYYRRQSAVLSSMGRAVTNREIGARLLAMAEDYQVIANNLTEVPANECPPVADASLRDFE